MTMNPEWSFEAHDLSSIMMARNNLAETALFRIETGYNKIDPENFLHLIGNLLIASCASTEEHRPLPEHIIGSLTEAAGGKCPTRHSFEEFSTRNAMLYIFSLQHIPSGAPEVRETKRSRELRVGEFIRQAHLLNPDAVTPAASEGMGRHVFTGWYMRKLH